MMHMTFYWSKVVTVLIDSWRTSTWTNYSLTLISLAIVAALYHCLEDLRVRLKRASPPSSSSAAATAPIQAPLLQKKLGGRFSAGRIGGAVLYGLNAAIGYFLMLAVMSFNGGVFVAIVLGLTIGYFAFRSGNDDVAVPAVDDNPCACA